MSWATAATNALFRKFLRSFSFSKVVLIVCPLGLVLCSLFKIVYFIMLIFTFGVEDSVYIIADIRDDENIINMDNNDTNESAHSCGIAL